MFCEDQLDLSPFKMYQDTEFFEQYPLALTIPPQENIFRFSCYKFSEWLLLLLFFFKKARIKNNFVVETFRSNPGIVFLMCCDYYCLFAVGKKINFKDKLYGKAKSMLNKTIITILFTHCRKVAHIHLNLVIHSIGMDPSFNAKLRQSVLPLLLLKQLHFDVLILLRHIVTVDVSLHTFTCPS